MANSWQHRWMHFLYLPSLRCPRIISPRGVGGAVTVSQPLRRQPHHFPWRPYWAVLAPSTQILTVLKTSVYSFFHSYFRGKFFTPALASGKFFLFRTLVLISMRCLILPKYGLILKEKSSRGNKNNKELQQLPGNYSMTNVNIEFVIY